MPPPVFHLSTVPYCLSKFYFEKQKTNQLKLVYMLQDTNTGVFTKKISNNISKHFSDIISKLLRSSQSSGAIFPLYV